MKIKIICLAGHSGAGKTTVAKMLGEKLSNAFVAHGDEIIIGPHWDIVKPLLNKTISEVLDIENQNKINKILKEFGDERLSNLLNELDGKTDFFISEFARMPVCNIWDIADYRIMVASNKNQRAINIEKRNRKRIEGDLHKYYRIKGLIRYLDNKDIVDNAKNIDYTIFNRYDETLEEEVSMLAKKITNGENIRRTLPFHKVKED